MSFEALSIRNFRLFMAGEAVSLLGTWMMVVAQDWLVLAWTGDSPRALVIVTVCQFTPLPLVTLWAGGLADRFDKRSLLIGTNLAAAALALPLGVLVLCGAVELWHIYVFALGLGTVTAVELPTRLSFISELVGPELFPNAAGLGAACFSAARVVGPALAGPLIAWWGTGPVMVLNAASFLASATGLVLVRTSDLHRGRIRSHAPGVLGGVRHVLSRRDLSVAMVLLSVFGLMGFNFQLTLPLLAKTVFHTNAAAFGLLTTSLAGGSLLAALATTFRRRRPSLTTVIGWGGGFGAAEALVGLAPGFTVAAVLLVLTGFGCVYFSQAINHYLQLGSAVAYRGRVMALYTLAYHGTTPLGSSLIGVISTSYGARAGLLVGGGAVLVTALGVFPSRTCAE